MKKAFVLVLALVALSAACGKQGDPIPPRMVMPVPISNLEAHRAEKGIVISWGAPEPKMDIARTRVFRSELDVAGEDCPNCPRRFDLIADLMPGDLKIEKGLAKFTDYNVKTEFLYSYRIVLCNSASFCSAESNMAELRFK